MGSTQFGTKINFYLSFIYFFYYLFYMAVYSSSSVTWNGMVIVNNELKWAGNRAVIA